MNDPDGKEEETESKLQQTKDELSRNTSQELSCNEEILKLKQSLNERDEDMEGESDEENGFDTL